MDEYVTRYERLKAGERYFSVNNDKWITVKGNHILLKDDETPEQAIKRVEFKSAIERIAKDEESEITIKSVRDDLEKYGGTNDISLLKGNEDGGIEHIYQKHSNDIDGIIDTLIKAPVVEYVKNRKVFIENDNYKVVLSLDYYGNKKTWLLTGYKKEQ